MTQLLDITRLPTVTLRIDGIDHPVLALPILPVCSSAAGLPSQACIDCGRGAFCGDPRPVAAPPAPRALYLMRITLPGGQRLIKLGVSRDPAEQRRRRLARTHEVRIDLLDQVPIPPEHDAVRLEKGLHLRLCRHAPRQIVPHAVYARHLTVRSEVYYPVLEPKIRGAFAIIRRHLKLPAPA